MISSLFFIGALLVSAVTVTFHQSFMFSPLITASCQSPVVAMSEDTQGKQDSCLHLSEASFDEVAYAPDKNVMVYFYAPCK